MLENLYGEMHIDVDEDQERDIDPFDRSGKKSAAEHLGEYLHEHKNFEFSYFTYIWVIILQKLCCCMSGYCERKSKGPCRRKMRSYKKFQVAQ